MWVWKRENSIGIQVYPRFRVVGGDKLLLKHGNGILSIQVFKIPTHKGAANFATNRSGYSGGRGVMWHHVGSKGICLLCPFFFFGCQTAFKGKRIVFCWRVYDFIRIWRKIFIEVTTGVGTRLEKLTRWRFGICLLILFK